VPAIPRDEDEVVFARRLVAQRCLYGVDKNPVAVDLSKMSLWLATLAKDHPLTFIDHALRHGDSLLGLSSKQIESLHWEPGAPILKGLGVHEALDRVSELRRQIREADESVPDRELRDLWDEALFELRKVRIFGDLVLAAFFEGEKAKDKEAKRVEYLSTIVSGRAEEHRERLDQWRHAEQPLAPFHWQLEFPEVFERDAPGFDAVVGNPPFAGGNKISATLGNHYLAFIKAVYPGSGQNSDLVGYFFALATSLLRRTATLGLTATNTVAQGDTRPLAFHRVLHGDAEIYSAIRSRPWPGRAALHISVVHLRMWHEAGSRFLDGKPVETINTRLWPAIEAEPVQLIANRSKSFMGSVLLGEGWYLDSDAAQRLAGSVKDPSLVLPFLNGADLNQRTNRTGSRYTINLPDLPLSECERRWPVLIQYLRETVKPQRATSKRAVYRERWWLHAERQASLYAAISDLTRVLVISNVSKHFAIAFCDAEQVFDHNVSVFTFGQYSAFAVLQSRIHDIWAEAFSSTLENRRGYRRSDCFETFPFPPGWENSEVLENAGADYDAGRESIISSSSSCLTEVYNRFNDPDDCSQDILQLRRLHTEMDCAVFNAYGWTDISSACEFLLDYEIDEEEWGNKKKPWRYRWPDEFRDDVLARLLELNAERAKEDARSGAAAARMGSKKRTAKRPPTASDTEDLFS
jgi:hypothetical protein